MFVVMFVGAMMLLIVVKMVMLMRIVVAVMMFGEVATLMLLMSTALCRAVVLTVIVRVLMLSGGEAIQSGGLARGRSPPLLLQPGPCLIGCRAQRRHLVPVILLRCQLRRAVPLTFFSCTAL